MSGIDSNMRAIYMLKAAGRIGLLLLMTFSLLITGACGPEKESRDDMPKRDITDVMNDHVDELMAIPGVTGVAIGALEDGTPYIMVLLLEESDELERKLPRQLEGHPVRPVVTGEIKPMEGQ